MSSHYFWFSFSSFNYNLFDFFQYFNQLRQNIISNQLPEKQCVMAQWFDNLMEGIERNLQTKNRER